MDLFSDISGQTYYCCSKCHQLLASIVTKCSNGCDSGVTDILIGPQFIRRLEGMTIIIVGIIYNKVCT